MNHSKECGTQCTNVHHTFYFCGGGFMQVYTNHSYKFICTSVHAALQFQAVRADKVKSMPSDNNMPVNKGIARNANMPRDRNSIPSRKGDSLPS